MQVDTTCVRQHVSWYKRDLTTMFAVLYCSQLLSNVHIQMTQAVKLVSVRPT